MRVFKAVGSFADEILTLSTQRTFRHSKGAKYEKKGFFENTRH